MTSRAHSPPVCHDLQRTADGGHHSQAALNNMDRVGEQGSHEQTASSSLSQRKSPVLSVDQQSLSFPDRLASIQRQKLAEESKTFLRSSLRAFKVSAALSVLLDWLQMGRLVRRPGGPPRQTTYVINRGRLGREGSRSYGQSHRYEETEGGSETGEVPLTREGGLYVDIYAGAANFLVTPLMLGPMCLLEEPVCPCLAVFICCRVKI